MLKNNKNTIRPTSKTGFTIVELLIVIVVIGILAAITIVAYNGIQDRSKLSIAKADLRSLSQQMEIFKVDNGSYPDTSTGPNYPEHEEVLRVAGLYELTRRIATTIPERSYLFCPYSDNSRYTIIAVRPVISDTGPEFVGIPVHYIQSGGTLQQTTLQWDGSLSGDDSTGGIGARNLCKSVDPTYDDMLGGIWSFHVPTTYAT